MDSINWGMVLYILALIFLCIVVDKAFYYYEKRAGKLYKSKVIQDNQLSVSEPTRPAPPIPKCKPSDKEPCCEYGRPMSKYFEDN